MWLLSTIRIGDALTMSKHQCLLADNCKYCGHVPNDWVADPWSQGDYPTMQGSQQILYGMESRGAVSVPQHHSLGGRNETARYPGRNREG